MRVWFKFILIVLMLTQSLIFAADDKPAYTVLHADAAPVIDGKLNDKVWKKARFTSLFDITTSTKAKKIKATPGTEFAVSADAKHIYLAFRCQDDNTAKLNKKYTTHDSKIWNGDNVEFFLNYDRGGHSFIRIMIGPTGALFDAAYFQHGLKEHRWFNIKGLSGATHIEADIWTGEIAIPFAGLAMKPGVKGNWQMNVCRSSNTKKKIGSHLSSWGVFTKKETLDKRNFFPVNLIRSTWDEKSVYSLFQDVAGFPVPTFTPEELKHITKIRRKQGFDKKLADFQMIVIPPKLPLESLLFYKDKNGKKQPLKTDAHRKIKRDQVLQNMQKAMGVLHERPKRNSLKDFNIRITSTIQRGTYTRKHIHFDVAKNELVHAHLYEPLNLKAGEKRPAIIALHPTAKHGKLTFEGWPNYNYVTELAMQGFVVIVPDYPTIGEAKDYDLKTDRYDSGPIKGVYNHMSSIDLLQQLPTVDPERIGAIGHSLGGRNTLYLMAFDERVKVGSSSCGWTTFRATTIFHERLLASDYFMPFLKTKYNLDLSKFPFEYTDAFAAIAPRVFFSYSPAGDGVHPGWGPKQAAPVIRDFYEAVGAKDSFIFKQPQGGHSFPWDWRQASYKVLRDKLNFHHLGDLALLAERKGKDAVPALKKALQSRLQKDRWVAAHYLGLQGDKSGLERLKKDFATLTAGYIEQTGKDAKSYDLLLMALNVSKVLAELGDYSGYSLASNLATKGADGLRWRATEVLAYLSNLDAALLKNEKMDPVGVLKTMAAVEQNSNEFFVYLDRVHKIMRSRVDMIAIFKIAKDNKFQSTLTVPWGETVAGVYWIVASRDKNRPYNWK
ncbi:MAG: hypothetical protein HRT89_19570 [Lentisphaeria bacterium]|nr:hypothetical protein [Lentisphaeria bacterium]NQZ70257.1 hypothetical protein [Lentisphaeria bacterium]